MVAAQRYSFAYRFKQVCDTGPMIVSMSVTSAERSFPKLKLLKNYLRYKMSQGGLNNFTILCIEKILLIKLIFISSSITSHRYMVEEFF